MSEVRTNLQRSVVCAIIGVVLAAAVFGIVILRVDGLIAQGSLLLSSTIVLLIASAVLLVAARSLLDKAVSQCTSAGDDAREPAFAASIARLTTLRTWADVVGFCAILIHAADSYWHWSSPSTETIAAVVIGLAVIVEIVTYVGMALAVGKSRRGRPTAA